VADIPTNLLYFGDNLTWLREHGKFPDESVDLVYLDPPFNSNRSYNVLFKESDVRESEAQIHAFEDTWAWDREGRVQAVFDDFWLTAPEKPKQTLKAFIDALGHNDVTAYLTMMAPRLVELHRVLKPTGSLWLHCDPTASHYLKVLLDSIFQPTNFRSEVIWRRSNSHNKVTRQLGPVHDTLLFYAKSTSMRLSTVKRPHYRRYIAEAFTAADEHGPYRINEITGSGVRKGESGMPWRGVDVTGLGRHWSIPGDLLVDMETAGLSQHQKLDLLAASGDIVFSDRGFPRYKQRPTSGVPFQDIWAYQPYTEGILDGTDEGVDRDVKWLEDEAERLGYDTQKPVGLLARVISVASHPGEVVLDPFCGCGTATHAAQKLGRRWIGIDITPLATNLIRTRLQEAFPGLEVPVEGWPVDMAGAIALAAQEDKYHFQDWAVIQCGARPAGGERKKGADRGVDGVIPFLDGKTPRRGVVSVKAGNTGPTHVRDLAGVVSRDEDAAFGVFICLYDPTKPMIEEALSHGTWVSEYDGKVYPKIQILCAQDVIDGGNVRMPPSRTKVFARVGRERSREGQQGRLT
jgi:site-specific DNA-methyltransferase (adenine-specific)